jgi:anhydro-N-acetylmuramic acid kinase
MAFVIGLMSGTSLDGLEGVLAEFDAAGRLAAVRAHAHRPYDEALRAELLALNSAGGTDELHRSALAANALADVGAALVAQLLQAAGMSASDVRAVGSHGQTVRHRPGEFDAHGGYTVQLDNPALLAERCGIDVVADLRRRDLAAGGQGAPLVPAFHAAQFARAGQARALLNLGGFANLTLLAADGSVSGFDCGPANVLLDGWHARHRGGAYDDGGRWAAGGKVDAHLLAALRSEPYFRRPPPKSTGRDLFHLGWLDAHLSGQEAPQDVQATLLELTASTVADDLKAHAPATRSLLACGGGALNPQLMARLAAHLPGVQVGTTADEGLPVNQVEAIAFAWLALRHLQRLPGNLPAVTGARHPCVLGALYPAR